MRRIAIALGFVCTLGGVAASAPPPGPQWVSGPDRAYNCTHYLDAPVEFRKPPQVRAGEPMTLILPRDKVMKFVLAATPTTNVGKVHFELEAGPPGAKLDAGRFQWKVAGTPGEHFEFAVVAVGEDGGRTRWPVAVTIASDALFTAWSAGMGSVWPDCDVYVDPRYEVRDLDGDGKDDVLYRTFFARDGTMETHVMLQRGTLKFVEATTCRSCAPQPDVAADGTRLLVFENECCCILSVSAVRFDGDHVEDVGQWQAPSSCAANADDASTITFVRDASYRITGLEQRNARGDRKRWRWRARTFELDEKP